MSVEMINAKDRIPSNVLANGAIRYGRYDENGNLLGYEYIKREDEPVEAGTNVNKVLFDFIDKEMSKAGLNEEYNIPILTANGNEVIEEFTEDITPNFRGTIGGMGSGASIDGYTIYASMESSNFPVGNAFDHKGSYSYNPSTSNGTTMFDCRMLFPNNKRISPKTIRIDASEIRGNCTVKGINEDDSTDLLGTVEMSGTSSYLYTLEIDTSKYYKGMIYEFSNNTSSYSPSIYLIEISTGTIKTLANSYTLNINKKIPQYTDKLITKLYINNDIFNSLPLYININNLGNKLLNGTFKKGYYYEIVYNADTDMFDIIENGDKDEIQIMNQAIANSLSNYNSNLIVSGKVTKKSTTWTDINLSFKPRLVIIYAEYNNDSLSTNSTNTPRDNYIPIILTPSYISNEYYYITDSGFSILSSHIPTGGVYYIAIR